MSRSLWLCLCAVFALSACADDDDPGAAQASLDGGATADAGAADLGGGAADLGEPDGDLPDALLPDAEPPGPGERGPYAVGFATETIEYMAPDEAEPRPLDLHWWYPTDATEGDRVRYGNLLTRPEVFGGAPPRDALADAPVLVFSHGNGGFAEQSYFFTEFLSSHGWVVVAPDHTGNTFAPGGGNPPIYRFFELRPTDIIAVLDHVDALPAEHPLAGRLSAARALAGHSFGGYTTLAVGGAGYDVDGLLAPCPMPPESDECQYVVASQDRYRAGFGDDRLQALIPMTPAGANLFGGDPGLAGIETPTLMMTAGRDATLPNPAEGDPLWAGITQADSLRLDFPNAGHFTFSDACTLPVPVGVGDGCDESFIEPVQAHAIINAYGLAFLRRHVLGDETDAALLDAGGFGDADVVRSTPE